MNDDLTSLLGMGCCALATVVSLVVLFYYGRRLYMGVGSIEKDVVSEESEFERNMLAEVGIAEPPRGSVGAPPLPVQADIALPLVPTAPATIPAPPTSPVVGEANAPGSVEELGKRLYALRIVTDLEGRIPLGVPPDGLIYRLRSGGTCGLIPRLESETVMNHLARRFDMLFVIASNGEVLVVERLQSRIPQLIDSPTDYGKS